MLRGRTAGGAWFRVAAASGLIQRTPIRTTGTWLKVRIGVTVMTSLVQLALGGAVELSFPPEGVTWRLKCPAKAAMPR